MINLKEWIVSVITTNTTLQNMLSIGNTGNPPYNVYPAGVDIQPENFPAITFQDAGLGLLNLPTGMHTGRFQLDVWSKLNQLEVDTIYTILARLVNYQHTRIATTVFPSGTLWWIKEEMATDTPETGRRLWRKIISYHVWASNTDES